MTKNQAHVIIYYINLVYQNNIMETNNELAKSQKTDYLDPIIWEQMKGMASTFIQSKALPIGIVNVPQAVMIMQTGLEMGMKPVEALQSLYIVNGGINVWGKATIRRLREHGFSLSYTETPDSCTATIQKAEEKYEETYTFQEAEKSGYTRTNSGSLKIGWKEGQNRKLKLRYGAVSALIKSYVPEVLGSANDIVEVAEDYEKIQGVEFVEIKKVEITNEQFDKFLKNSFEYINKHKHDYLFTEEQELKLKEVLEGGQNE